MKRSERIRQQAVVYYQYSLAWGLVTIAISALAFAYHGAIYGCAFITACFAARWYFDGANKARLAKVERQYERSQEIKRANLSL